MTVAERIKWWRQSLGITMAELARRIGVSDVAVLYWERGDNDPTMAHIAKFCDVLNVSASDFWSDPPRARAS